MGHRCSKCGAPYTEERDILRPRCRIKCVKCQQGNCDKSCTQGDYFHDYRLRLI